METKHLEKIANMVLVNVPQNQIAAACNVSESRISQIINLPEYKLIEQKVAVDKFEESEMLNMGWDSVEALGVKHTILALNNNPEPEFALKAALVANKAVRRGTFQNQPIPQSAGIRAVIHLNPVFVDKLQQNFDISEERFKHLTDNPKDSDFMPAADVHSLLGKKVEGVVVKHDVATPVTSPEIDFVGTCTVFTMSFFNGSASSCFSTTIPFFTSILFHNSFSEPVVVSFNSELIFFNSVVVNVL